MPKRVLVFGNQDLKRDSLPIRLLPNLQKRLPRIDFELKDPNDDWSPSKDLVVLDTVEGISKVTVFNDLDTFMGTPRMTTHDFDALTNLKYLKKLGKFETIKIIGVPPTLDQDEALDAIKAILSATSP